jgi:hypothetical protein
MADYLVEWSCEIEADNPVEAARMALEMHRDPTSTATVFTVIGTDMTSTEVDLDVVGLGEVT